MTPPDPEPVLDRAAHGYRATLASQVVRVACKAASVIILARLVSPADHGLFAMAGSVMLVLVLFRDFGLGTAAVQAPTLTEEQKTTLWHVHVVLGIALMLVTLALTPVAAAFFHEPRVRPLLAVSSVMFLFLGLNSWPRTLLNRELRIGEVSRFETQAAVVGTAAMIAAGALGAGAYAFVVFLIVPEVWMLFAAWRVCRWRATAPARWASLRPLLASGTNFTGHSVLTYFLQQIDALFMGRWFGAGPLGLYSRPGQLLAMPVTHVAAPLANVLLAALSRLDRSSPDFARHLRDTANLIAHLTLPLAALCLVLPHEIVRLLLGPAWPEAGPLLRWIALTATTTYLTAALAPLCVATGHTRRLLVMSAVSLPAIVLGMWLGRPYGPRGLAAGVALANLALLLPRLLWATWQTPVQPRDFAAAYAGPLATSAAFAAGLSSVRLFGGAATPAVRLAAAVAVGGLAVLLVVAAWPRLRREFHTVWRHRPGANAFAATP